MGRRKRESPSPGDVAVRRAFETVAQQVERGKSALVSAVPSARIQGRPVAEALLEFEESLREARGGMEAWRRKEHEPLWLACDHGLREAARRAEAFRLEAPALDFEALVTILGDLMAPLDPFADAERALARGR